MDNLSSQTLKNAESKKTKKTNEQEKYKWQQTSIPYLLHSIMVLYNVIKVEIASQCFYFYPNLRM